MNLYIYFQFVNIYLLLNNNDVFKLSEQCLLDSFLLIIHCVNRLEQVSQKCLSNICFHEYSINLVSIIVFQLCSLSTCILTQH